MRKKNKSQLRKNIVAGLLGILSGALLFGLTEYIRQPNLPVHVDQLDHDIQREETPLGAAPVVEKTTTSTSSTRKVSLGKASSKSYTKNLPDKVTTSTKTSGNADSSVKTVTTVEVKTSEKYTKGSRQKVVRTRTKTTVVTTTTRKETENETSQNTATRTTSVRSEAPKMPSHILGAFETLGFRLVIDPSYKQGDGAFNARTRTITMKEANSPHVYHELGHFVSFAAGNIDATSAFRAIYQEEKNSFQGIYRGYAVGSSQEFFAECVREYIMHPDELSATCPNAYAAVEAAMEKITLSQVASVQKSYGRVWAND